MNIADISDSILNCGLESKATVKISLAVKTIDVIYINEYMRSSLSGMDFIGGDPMALCRTSDIKEIKIERDSIRIFGENDNKYFTVRDVKPNSKNISILILSID